MHQFSFPNRRRRNGSKLSLAFTLKGIEAEFPYIQGRGIFAETAEKYGVGHFKGKGSTANRVVFPLHERALIGYAGRTVLELRTPIPNGNFENGLVNAKYERKAGKVWAAVESDQSRGILIC